MSLPIFDEEILRLAEELGQKTGQEPAAVVKDIIEEKLRQIDKEKPRHQSGTKLSQIAASFQKRMVKNGMTSKEMLDELYDENGLPH